MNKKIITKNLNSLARICPLEKIQIFNEDLIIVVKPEIITDVLLFLKYHTLYQFKLLTCISGVDYPMNKYRFQIVYELLSLRYNYRIRIKTFTHELLSVNSCDKIFHSEESVATYLCIFEIGFQTVDLLLQAVDFLKVL